MTSLRPGHSGQCSPYTSHTLPIWVGGSDGEGIPNNDRDPHNPDQTEDSRYNVQDASNGVDTGSADGAAREPPHWEDEEAQDQDDRCAGLEKIEGTGIDRYSE